MTARQRDNIIAAIVEYANAEVDLACVVEPISQKWINRANDAFKKIEDLLVVDAWEIR